MRNESGSVWRGPNKAAVISRVEIAMVLRIIYVLGSCCIILGVEKQVDPLP